MLVTLAYRYQRQRAADVHAWIFPDRDLAAERTSDPRLGALEDHSTFLSVRWTFAGESNSGPGWDLTLDAYLSWLDYQDTSRPWMFSHVFSTGLAARY